jgi:hypothetical protein
MCDDIVFGATGAEQPFVTNDGGITAAVQGNIASTSTAPVGVSITLNGSNIGSIHAYNGAALRVLAMQLLGLSHSK